MIQATARVLHNVIEIRVGQEMWTCRPVVGSTGAVARRIAALFSTVYETYRSSEPDTVHSTVSYHPKKDEIIIQIGEQKWRTRASAFGPMTIEYGDMSFQLNEKLTGRFALMNDGHPTAVGELGFRSCEIRDYPTDLEGFLANFSLGLLIRKLVWE
jgi:hypothetical protein